MKRRPLFQVETIVQIGCFYSHVDGGRISTKEEFNTMLAAFVIQKSEFVHNFLDCILIIIYSCHMISSKMF